ncbi:MAG: TolC family protein [Candidatus Binataceae bacterium]|nr:TolC family protein [Candidatus Binataceae bacterium]
MISSSTRCLLLLFVIGVILPRPCVAAERSPGTITIEQAVDYSLARQPSLRAAGAVEAGEEAGLEYSRANYLPEFDLSAQETRATANNVPGLFLTMPGFPIIEENKNGGVFGSSSWNSATSVFLSKDVAGLLREMALVDVALARRERATAGLDADKLTVAFGAANAFMGEVAAAETVRAARAGVERARVFAVAVKGRVNSGLRPGADASRADAEVALALNQEISAEQAERIARATLVEALGGRIDSGVKVASGRLLDMPATAPVVEHASPVDPFLHEALAEISAARASTRAAKFEYLPRVEVVAGIFQRDSGFSTNAVPGPGNGLVPNTTNWAAGVVVTIPIKGLFQARADVHAQTANEQLAKARYDQVTLAIQNQIDSASAILDGARQIAANTPAELAAAHATELQDTARYKGGLATVIDVAEADRILTQAEVDNAVARVNVWRAMLLLARAVGDLDPLLTEIRDASGGH